MGPRPVASKKTCGEGDLGNFLGEKKPHHRLCLSGFLSLLAYSRSFGHSDFFTTHLEHELIASNRHIAAYSSRRSNSSSFFQFQHISAPMAESKARTGVEPSDRVVIGITFGNSNSSIAYTVDDKAEVIANEDGGTCYFGPKLGAAPPSAAQYRMLTLRNRPTNPHGSLLRRRR